MMYLVKFLLVIPLMALVFGLAHALGNYLAKEHSDGKSH